MGLAFRAATWLGGGCSLAALMAHGGRFSDFLDLFTHFAPLYLGGAVVVGVMALGRRSRHERRRLIVLSSVAAFSSLLLMAPEVLRARPSSATAGPGETLKIVQFNLDNDDRWNRRIVAWLAREDPDIIVLDDMSPALRNDISKTLVGRNFTCTEDCRVALISKARPAYSEGFFGGRYGLTPATALARFGEGEDSFVVAGTHLAKPFFKGADSRTTQAIVQIENARRLRTILKAYRQSNIILVGDFNSTPWSFTHRREEEKLGLERRTRFLFSWPANPTNIAFLPIDHVYAGKNWRTASIARGPHLGSDHYPVVAVLERVSGL